MARHLAQLNIARLKHPIDDPRIADFVDALPLVNGSGEQSTGYVWRLQSDGGDATDIQVFEDPLVIVNLTVWESLDALKQFAYRGVHRDFFRRRGEWFVDGQSRTALWWIAAGTVPTTDDAKRRLDFIDAFGTSPYAFEMGQQQRALTIERVTADDRRLATMSQAPSPDSTQLVVAELDDEPVAWGAYRRSDATAEIERMHVAQQARGLRVGAALVAELEAAARANGLHRLCLHTSQHNTASLPLYEKFGFHRCESEPVQSASSASMCLEKALAAEPSRLA